ncbi:MAG: hypothetical protein HC802_11575 [Caldilineaceae bacterium]|nr:hypothetical protein [Caldilineaceae bacterium]
MPVIVLADSFVVGKSDGTEADALIDMAEKELLRAQDSLDFGDRVSGGALLIRAEDLLAEAEALIGRTERIEQIGAEIDREMEDVLLVQPLYGLVDPLLTFPADAEPHRVLVSDQDLFVLDTARQQVEHFQIDPSGAVVSDPLGEVVLREGDVVEGQRIGRLADIAWQPLVPGVEDKSNLLVLDHNKTVFRFNDRVDGATVLAFGDQESWQAPAQIDTYLGRIYLADEGAGQIYRYNPGQYQATPEHWFQFQAPVNLAGLLTMAIDGDIWLLINSGVILRYSAGEQVPFSLDSSVGYAEKPVDMVVGAADTGLIYLADAAEERIMVFDKSGAYQYQLTAAEGNPLRELRSLFVDDLSGVLYILTDSALYTHPLPR